MGETEARWLEDMTPEGIELREMMKKSMGEFKYAIHDMDTESRHLDGIPWHAAPVPPRFHRCRTQTYGYLGIFRLIERCACGAIRENGRGRWDRKNERRRG